MNNLLFIIITIFLLSDIVGCSSKGGDYLLSNTISNPTEIKQIPSNGGIKFVKEKGWEIPDFSLSKKKETYSLPIEISESEKITVTVTNYEIENEDLVTDEPFKSINWNNIGKIQIRELKEFSIKGHKFCYKIQANRIGHGSLFYFAFYDDDGDGVFETLLLDEKDKSGLSSFHLPPHIPSWLQKV
jgi:hypothetical protein